MLLNTILLVSFGLLLLLLFESERWTWIVGSFVAFSTVFCSLEAWNEYVTYGNLDSSLSCINILPSLRLLQIDPTTHLDRISLFFVLLTAFFTPICFVLSFRPIKEQQTYFLLFWLWITFILILFLPMSTSELITSIFSELINLVSKKKPFTYEINPFLLKFFYVSVIGFGPLFFFFIYIWSAFRFWGRSSRYCYLNNAKSYYFCCFFDRRHFSFVFHL